PLICDILHQRTSWRHAVNVLNSGPYIDNLPRSAAVEVPAIVDGQGIHPQPVGALPEPYTAHLRTQCAIVELVTEAYRTRSKNALLQALLLDPVVTSISNAERLLDDMLALQREYLPSFS
ncbi:MAG: alpha-glucosidase/alpha-galactosidase, partial [Chloroflexi bacterium]|nr:alpha-glucosidase/alpha-galactosidase [Chloroflexota bacterium]